MTKHGVRKKKATRWTRQFDTFDKNVRESFPQMPSPRTSTWRNYIKYRLTIMKRAIEVHTTEKYTRLRFDKYIESNRVCDLIAAMLVSILNSIVPCYILMNLIDFIIAVLLLLLFQNRQIVSRALS